jgi:hypothetical protein
MPLLQGPKLGLLQNKTLARQGLKIQEGVANWIKGRNYGGATISIG